VGLRDIFDQEQFPWAARPDQVGPRIVALRAALGPGRRPRRLLDLGCGGGENTKILAEGLGGCDVVGVDWARHPLARARAGGLVVVQALLDGADLPFADASFDVVALSEVIEHLVDPDRLVEEARRVLEPGGVFLVTTPNLAAWFNRLLLGAGIQPVFSEVSSRKVFGRPGDVIVGHLRLFTRRALVELLHDLGFAEVRVSGATFHGVPRPLRPLDRLFAHWPDAAAGLVAVTWKPASRAPALPGQGPARAIARRG
jgi:SAM-dependent methyltransferase